VGQIFEDDICSGLDAAWVAASVTEALEKFDMAVREAKHKCPDVKYFDLFKVHRGLHRSLSSYPDLCDSVERARRFRLRFPGLTSELARWIALALLRFVFFGCNHERNLLSHDDVVLLDSQLSDYCTSSILYMSGDVHSSYVMIGGALHSAAMAAQKAPMMDQAAEYFLIAKQSLSKWLLEANPFPMLLKYHTRVADERDNYLRVAFVTYFKKVRSLLYDADMIRDRFEYPEVDYSHLSADQRDMNMICEIFMASRHVIMPIIRQNCTKSYLFDLLVGSFLFPGHGVVNAVRLPHMVSFMAGPGRQEDFMEAIANLKSVLYEHMRREPSDIMRFVSGRASLICDQILDRIKLISRAPRAGYV
jgi:hypothetical protein